MNPTGAAMCPHRSTITFTPSVISRGKYFFYTRFSGSRQAREWKPWQKTSAILSFQPQLGQWLYPRSALHPDLSEMDRTLSSRNIHPQQYSLADYVFVSAQLPKALVTSEWMRLRPLWAVYSVVFCVRL